MSYVPLTDVNLIILSIMNKPIHGYEIMQVINESKLSIDIGPATTYTVLKKLLSNGLCTIKSEGRKNYYLINEKGLKEIKKTLQYKRELMDFVEDRSAS